MAEFAAECRLRHRARVIKIQDGREKTCSLRFGVEPIRLPDRAEMLDLVVAGFGCDPQQQPPPNLRMELLLAWQYPEL